ncbi:hypothetical protein J4206_02825 [Candidatus Woesearchaeota archaeon]|nr:hypothetical protein [Candidatus Woesearchaeota archaeon]
MKKRLFIFVLIFAALCSSFVFATHNESTATASSVDTSCNSYCDKSVYYFRGYYNTAAQKCYYLSQQCSLGCDKATNKCVPEPAKCSSYCSKGVYYYRGYAGIDGSCFYSKLQCEYGCNDNGTVCASAPIPTTPVITATITPVNCHDSDGNSTATSGTVTVTYSDGTTRAYNDGCRFHQSYNPRVVSEYVCDDTRVDKLRQLDIDCAQAYGSSSSCYQGDTRLGYCSNIPVTTTQVTPVTPQDEISTQAPEESEISETIEIPEEKETAIKVDEQDETEETTEVPEEKKTEITAIQPDSCSIGCLDQNNNCIPVGIRIPGKYCDIDREIKPQLNSGISCNNNYECGSNFCADGKCTAAGFMQKILNFFGWIINIFGGEGDKEEAKEIAEEVRVVEEGSKEPQPAPIVNLGQYFTDNIVNVDIEGVGEDIEVMIISGPTVEIEQIPGFTQTHPDDNPGRATLFPLVFEYDGALKTEIELYKNLPINLTIRVKELDHETVAFSWYYRQYMLTDVQPGFEGRSRYTLTAPLHYTRVPMFRDPSGINPQMSRNPETDSEVEISGVIQDVYPVVEVNETARKITLTFDYVEAGGIWDWVRNFVQGIPDKRSMGVIQNDPANPDRELSARNYYEVWPIWYSQSEGFSLPQKAKEKVVLTFSRSEERR